MQNKFNLTERKSEPTLNFCAEHNIAFLPWYPLNAGKDKARLEAEGNAIGDFARENLLTLDQLSLAWLLHRSPVILPIPGTSSVEHLEQNVRAGQIELPDDLWDRFDLILDTQAM